MSYENEETIDWWLLADRRAERLRTWLANQAPAVFVRREIALVQEAVNKLYPAAESAEAAAVDMPSVLAGNPGHLLAEVDRLTIELHVARRTVAYDRSGNIAADLRALRVEIDAARAACGLGPSPVLPTWDGEEDES